jgi:hypothetical protein
MRGHSQVRQVRKVLRVPQVPGLLWLWIVFAFVVWNVVFDRRSYEASVNFTQQQIRTYQAGQPVTTIEAGFRPQLRKAALEASAWGGSVLAAGFVLTMVLNRKGQK